MITPWGCNFWTGGLTYDSIPLLGLSLWSPIGFTQKIPWWYLDQQYINGKESFSLLFLYYHVFPHSLWHFTKQHWNPWKAAARDIAKTREAAAAPSPTGRSGEVTLGWACGSKGKEESRGEGLGRSWEEKEDDEVPSIALGWGVRGRGHLIGGGWRILGYGI